MLKSSHSITPLRFGSPNLCTTETCRREGKAKEVETDVPRIVTCSTASFNVRTDMLLDARRCARAIRACYLAQCVGKQKKLLAIISQPCDLCPYKGGAQPPTAIKMPSTSTKKKPIAKKKQIAKKKEIAKKGSAKKQSKHTGVTWSNACNKWVGEVTDRSVRDGKKVAVLKKGACSDGRGVGCD